MEKPDPKIQKAEKAIKKAEKAAEDAKAAINEAAAAKKHPRRLNKARKAVQDSIESLARGSRWIDRYNRNKDD